MMRNISLITIVLIFSASLSWSVNYPIYTQPKFHEFYEKLERQGFYPEGQSLDELDLIINRLEANITQEAPTALEYKKMGVYYHAKAVQKNGKLSDANQAEKYFTRALDLLVVQNQEEAALYNNLRGWQGGVLALKPKFGLSIFETIQLSNQGTSLLDRAVFNDPKDLELRFLRANTYVYFPKFLGKMKTVIGDLEYLSAYFNAYYQEKSDAIMKVYALFCYAYKNEGDKEKMNLFRQKVLTLAPRSVFAQKVKEL